MEAMTGINVPLTKLELAASLGAVRAVMDSAPGDPPAPLQTAAAKFHESLTFLSFPADDDAQEVESNGD